MVRRAVAAGQLYPEDPAELRHLVKGLLGDIQLQTGPAPKAIIVPHAGYHFSGPVAASAYARFLGDRDVIKRVVLVGPAHYLAVSGVAASSAEAFATPLGLVPVDTEAVRQICLSAGVSIRDAAHEREHSLEVQLPFLQMILGDFKIVPLVTGDDAEYDLAAVIARLWGGPETRFVISSDLSHYHRYSIARDLDAATSRAVEELRPQDIGEEHACGRIPIRGLLRAARLHEMHARTVDLRNSADTSGMRSDVVGYGAFVFDEKGCP